MKKIKITVYKLSEYTYQYRYWDAIDGSFIGMCETFLMNKKWYPA